MTRAEILALPAGRELDVLVGNKIMGLYRDERAYLVDADRRVYHGMPYYSTDIAAAWQVVEKLRGVRVSRFGDNAPPYQYQCEAGVGEHANDPGRPHHIVSSEADTAPLAICRAALLTTISEAI